MNSFILASVLLPATLLPALAQTQGAISSPLAGLFAIGAEVRPIQGVPGASLVGDPIALPGSNARVYLAPLDRWALVETARAASLSLVTFDGAAPGAATPIAGSLPSPDLVAFSPNGRNAVVYASLSGALQVLTHLDTAPQIAIEADASSLAVAAVAIGDDGALPVVWTRGAAVYLLRAGASPAPLFATGATGGMTFLPNQPVLAVVDGSAGSLTLLENLAGRPTTRLTISGPQLSGDGIFVSATADGSGLIFGAAGGDTVYRADLAGQVVSSVNLPAGISRLERIGRDVFLVSAKAGDAAWMVQADGATLRAGFAQGIARPREGAVRGGSSPRQ